MAQYEAELDRKLAKRNDMWDKAMDRGQEYMQAFQNQDFGKLQEQFDKLRDASMHVRDVNRRYERQIESILPEDQRAKFADEFKRDSFPMIYRQSFASRTLD